MLQVVVSDDMRMHTWNKFDLVDFSDPRITKFKVLKTSSLNDVKSDAENEFKIDKNNQVNKLFAFVTLTPQ